jgi:hypothetical protein
MVDIHNKCPKKNLSLELRLKVPYWHHDIQHNDTQHIDTQRKGIICNIQNNYTEANGIQDNNFLPSG